MQIQIQTANFTRSDSLDERVRQEVEAALRLWKDQVTRVEVHLHDDNGPKAGVDKRCVIEVRMAGHQPLAVEATAHDVYQSAVAAAGKLERAVRNRVERHEAHRGRGH